MKIVLLILAFILLSCSLQAGIAKSFPNGYILCVFDRPSTITNHGSKLVVGLQDPATNRRIPLSWADDSPSHLLQQEFVATGNNTDEVHNGRSLTIKKPVSIFLWNFKGGKVDVEFSILPKQIKCLRHLP